MNKSYRDETMLGLYDNTQDAPTSKDGFLSGGRRSENERLMANYSVNRDGLRFEYHGYHYDKLADALAYSKLVGTLPGKDQDDAAAYTPNPSIDLPNDDDRKLMASMHIRFDEGTYRYDGYRYNRLLDAVNYARLSALPLAGFSVVPTAAPLQALGHIG